MEERAGLATPKLPSEGGSSIPRRRYLEQELLEVSAVGIPANPNALALGLKAGVLEKSDLNALADLIRLTVSGKVKACDSGNKLTRGRSSRSQLLRLARDLRSILKHAYPAGARIRQKNGQRVSIFLSLNFSV